MSIDDEIFQKKQSMQAAINAAARREEQEKRLSDALQAAGMHNDTPVLHMPSADLRAIITETMPRMIFVNPKIIRSLPDGIIRVRRVNKEKGEKAGDYSFDVLVSSDGAKNPAYTYIWFFKNGSVAFSKSTATGTDLNVDNIDLHASQVREKIIETIARAQIEMPSKSVPSSNSGSTSSSTGCYIATAVYGSYNCPEVWVLRRYRDYVLQSTWYGKMFIKAYYTLSPLMVKVFGKKEWFQRFCRKKLDKMINKLQRKGFSNKPYVDE